MARPRGRHSASPKMVGDRTFGRGDEWRRRSAQRQAEGKRVCCRMIIRLLVVALVCLFVMSPVMAWAERVWDSDLKRYLTEQELSMAEVYLTEEEALKLMFPKSDRIKKDLLSVSAEKKIVIEDRIGWKFPEEAFEVYIGETGTQVDGYAFVQNTIGKHKPMTYMVRVDARWRVFNVELLI